MTRVFAILAAAIFFSTSTALAGTNVWYATDYDGPVPATLSAALAAEKEILGADNPGWKVRGGKEVCAAFGSVKLPCDYNTRSTVAMFLAFNGKGLFPAAGGTNPYIDEPLSGFPDDWFVGQPVQNRMLAEAIRRNAGLFADGDLSAEEVKNLWR